MNRSVMREKCMVMLYQIHLFESKNLEYDINTVISNNIDYSNDFVDTLVNGVLGHTMELDDIANKYMVNWTIDRIDKPATEILRIAFYELLYMDTPKVVVINEAIELAKKYSDEAVRKIVNATLDKYINEEK